MSKREKSLRDEDVTSCWEQNSMPVTTRQRRHSGLVIPFSLVFDDEKRDITFLPFPQLLLSLNTLCENIWFEVINPAAYHSIPSSFFPLLHSAPDLHLLSGQSGAANPAIDLLLLLFFLSFLAGKAF